MTIHYMARRILIIDDQEDIRELVGLALKGHRIAMAVDGQDGLEKARVFRPDLVIVDVMMPRMDGHTFLAELRKDPALRWTKALILSAKAMQEDQMEGYRLGAIDYITKPFRKEMLRIKVQRLLELKYAHEVGAYQQMVWRFLNHHIRNPLNILEIGTELVRMRSQGTDDTGAMMAEGVKALAGLVEQGSFLNDLISDPPDLDSVNLGRIVNDRIGPLRERAEARGGRDITVRVPDPETVPSLVLGEPKLLGHTVDALLDNAVDHTRPDDAIRVELGQSGTDFMLSVRDTGPGIDESRLARLFEPYRIDFETGADTGARFGLSLPVASLVSRICGGELTVESPISGSPAPDGSGGTCFRLRLPLVGTTPRPGRDDLRGVTGYLPS